MEDNLTNSILTICKTLNKHEVQYIIVGGTAVALHGYFRHSTNSAGAIADKPDLDFWYQPAYDNYFKLLNALEALGQNVSKFKLEQAPNPRKSFFKYDFEQFTLDLLPELKAPLNFSTSFTRREVVILNGIDIPFINYEDLILDKQMNPRPKDLDDIEQLRKAKGK